MGGKNHKEVIHRTEYLTRGEPTTSASMVLINGVIVPVGKDSLSDPWLRLLLLSVHQRNQI